MEESVQPSVRLVRIARLGPKGTVLPSPGSSRLLGSSAPTNVKPTVTRARENTLAGRIPSSVNVSPWYARHLKTPGERMVRA